MFLTVTPNLCIERTLLVADFQPGHVHRVAPQNLHVNAGGKGINAARVASALGCETLATGWVGRRQHDWFRGQLKLENVPHDLVEIEADTRVCLNVLHGAGHKTELVEAGQPLQIADGTRLLEKFAHLVQRASLVAICGSYPPAGAERGLEEAAPFDAHLSLLTQIAARRGCRVIVDGKGAAYSMAVRSKPPPWCIKPNLDEAAALLRRSLDSEAQQKRAVRDLLRFGPAVVLLSCGARGAYLGTAQGTWFLTAPDVREVSAVGSGDALVGAFAARFLHSGDVLEAARWGVAAGAANAAQDRSAFCSRADIEVLLPQVRVRMIQQTLAVV